MLAVSTIYFPDMRFYFLLLFSSLLRLHHTSPSSLPVTMKRAFKSFFGIKKKSDQTVLAHSDHHDQRNRDTPPSNTRTIYNRQDLHPIPISRNNTRPLSHPNTNINPRSLGDIKVYEERLQDLESRIAEVTEQLSHKIRLHNKALEHDRPDNEDKFLQSLIAHDVEAFPQRRKDKGKSREQTSRSPEPIPHHSSSMQGPGVSQKSVHRRSMAQSSAIDIPRLRESFVYADQDSFFDPEDYDSSHTTDTYHLSPNALRYVHDDQLHGKDKQSKSTRKPLKRNANSYVSYDTSSSKNSSLQTGHPSSSDIDKANKAHLPKGRMHPDTTNTKPTSTRATTSAPWQPHVVSPSQAAVTAVSSTGCLFVDHTSPSPSKSRQSMMLGDRRDAQRLPLPWTPQDHTSHTTIANDSSGSLEESATHVKMPIQYHRASTDLDHSTMDTKVLSTQIKTDRHQPLFHESRSTLSVHAKIELSKLEDDNIQQAHRVIHPYTGLDTSQIHESSMIMEPRPVLSSRDPGTSPSTPRGFVAPGSPPQRLRSPIAIATSPRSNYLLSTSPISIVSSEQGTKRFSSATSRGTARRIIYSAELEQGLPKGHIARESNYEVVGYRGLDGRLSPTSPKTSIVASSPSYASQMEAQGLSTRQVESPATIVVRPRKGASAQVTIRATAPSSSPSSWSNGGKKGKGRKHGPHGAHADSSSKETGN